MFNLELSIWNEKIIEHNYRQNSCSSLYCMIKLRFPANKIDDILNTNKHQQCFDFFVPDQV